MFASQLDLSIKEIVVLVHELNHDASIIQGVSLQFTHRCVQIYVKK
jgi:hypothetical protein